MPRQEADRDVAIKVLKQSTEKGDKDEMDAGGADHDQLDNPYIVRLIVARPSLHAGHGDGRQGPLHKFLVGKK